MPSFLAVVAVLMVKLGYGGPVPSDRLEGMDIEQWWTKLSPETQEWLTANNGDSVSIPSNMVTEIRAAGGSVITDPWWIYHIGPTGFSLSDAATDWIEAVANGEDPNAH
ncbi:hypothetical protein [Cryobacterium lactosi]|nr:hypothetical protein [Cryobacterium lactosi]